jgi:hypothetical protein
VETEPVKKKAKKEKKKKSEKKWDRAPVRRRNPLFLCSSCALSVCDWEKSFLATLPNPKVCPFDTQVPVDTRDHRLPPKYKALYLCVIWDTGIARAIIEAKQSVGSAFAKKSRNKLCRRS